MGGRDLQCSGVHIPGSRQNHLSGFHVVRVKHLVRGQDLQTTNQCE